MTRVEVTELDAERKRTREECERRSEKESKSSDPSGKQNDYEHRHAWAILVR
jgi:hypothetical protein